MATHNGGRFLREQIDSILPQLSATDEFIFSDDNSSDNSLDIIRAYQDARFVIHSNSFRSPVRNFEYALSQSKGDFIFLADQDDVWSSSKIESMLELLGNADMVLSDCSVTNERMEILHPSFFAMNHSRPGLIKNLWKNAYIGCCMAFRRSVLEAALPFPSDVPAHDAWLGLIAERDFVVRFLQKPLVQFRRHSTTFSTTAAESTSRFTHKISQRWRLAKALINH